MDNYILSLWLALFVAHQAVSLFNHIQAQKRRRLIAARLKDLEVRS